jgi:hypothetical protein
MEVLDDALGNRLHVAMHEREELEPRAENERTLRCLDHRYNAHSPERHE